MQRLSFARYNDHVVWNDKQLNLKLLRKSILTRIYAPMVCSFSRQFNFVKEKRETSCLELSTVKKLPNKFSPCMNQNNTDLDQFIPTDGNGHMKHVLLH